MNDSPSEPALKDPEDNPWYLLATLYGVPDGTDLENRQTRNRVAWNRYYSQYLTEGDREFLKGKIQDKDMVKLNEGEIKKIELKFKERANGRDLLLPGVFDDIDFKECIFRQSVDFDEYIFYNVNFSNSLFMSFADFKDSIFMGAAIFEKCIFKSIASFRYSSFRFISKFQGSIFQSFSNFQYTAFSGRSDFSSASFTRYVKFRNSIFSDDVDFKETTFGGIVDLINVEMKDPAIFEKCSFNSQPPRLAGAKLHQGTVWLDAKWPKVPKTQEEAARFIQAYEPLKLEMDRLKKHEDELFFFAKELECRRVAAGQFKGMPIALYGVLCDYGQNYLQPLGWLLALIVVGAVQFWPAVQWDCWLALGVSTANTLGSLGVRKEMVDPDILRGMSRWLVIVSCFQMLSGLILLFLTGLCLRNRFRMK